MKLARRLTFFLLGGMVVVLAIYAIMGIRQQIELFESDTLRDHQVLGRALAASAASVWKAEGLDAAVAVVNGAQAGETELQARWRFVDQLPSISRSELPKSDWDAVREGREVHRVVAHGEQATLISAFPITRGGVRAAIEIRESLAARESYIRSSIKNAVLTVLAFFGVSGVLATFLGVSLVGRPVHKLVEQARRIGQGDLSARLLVERADEIGELSSEMNAMVERLDAAQRKVESETRARLTALEQLRHADRLTTVGKLASGVAHELGTPLNVVSGRAQMIARGQVAGEAVTDNARMIVQQTERMTHIIRQLLAFARVSAPKDAVVDLNELAAHVVELLEPLAKKRSVSLTIENDGRPARARGDGGQLEQVLTNLVVNAIHAMKGPGPVQIRVGRERREPPGELAAGGVQDWIRLEVKDVGSGIPPEAVPHVFEPFFTTKDVGEGTGLGLSVAHGIVHEHKGFIELETELGTGTRFSVFLPAEVS